MNYLHSISLVLFLAATVPAHAADNTATMPDPAASMPQDCGKAIKPHDHGAERGTRAPSGKAAKAAMPCDGTTATAASKSKSKPAHDHGRMHKTQ